MQWINLMHVNNLFNGSRREGRITEKIGRDRGWWVVSGGVTVWPGPNHVFAWSQIVYDLIDAELLINILFSMYFCFHSVACLCLLLVIAVDNANEHWRELLVHRQRWSIYFTVHCIVHQQCISISVSWRINCVYTVMTDMHAFIDRLNGWKSIQISKMCIFFCFSINLYHCHIPYPIKKKTSSPMQRVHHFGNLSANVSLYKIATTLSHTFEPNEIAVRRYNHLQIHYQRN